MPPTQRSIPRRINKRDEVPDGDFASLSMPREASILKGPDPLNRVKKAVGFVSSERGREKRGTRQKEGVSGEVAIEPLYSLDNIQVVQGKSIKHNQL